MAPAGIPATSAQEAKLFPVVLLVLLLGPSVARPLLTCIFYGRGGLREFLSRLRRLRVGARWYAVALLTIPLLATAVLSVLSLTSPVFLPALVTTSDEASLLLSGVAVGLAGAFLEELGWTGFAVRGLRRHYGMLTTGLIMGFLRGSLAHANLLLGKRQCLRSAVIGPLLSSVPLAEKTQSALAPAITSPYTSRRKCLSHPSITMTKRFDY